MTSTSLSLCDTLFLKNCKKKSTLEQTFKLYFTVLLCLHQYFLFHFLLFNTILCYLKVWVFACLVLGFFLFVCFSKETGKKDKERDNKGNIRNTENIRSKITSLHGHLHTMGLWKQHFVMGLDGGRCQWRKALAAYMALEHKPQRKLLHRAFS